MAAAIIAVVLGTYVVGYVSLGRYDELRDIKTGRLARVTRIYRDKWVADAFYPLASLEGWCFGIDVYLGYAFE